jgi:hypothetical protein
MRCIPQGEKPESSTLRLVLGGAPNNSTTENREICDWVPESEMRSAAEMRVMDNESKNGTPILRDKG